MIKCITTNELKRRNGQTQVRINDQMIAIFMLSEGEIFVTDNRCPHEGYPLSQGSVDCEYRLTCHWHNWKFDLKSGDCLTGGDDLMVYPTEIRDGEVWADLSEPPKELRLARALKGFDAALMDGDFGWIARELCRVHAAVGSYQPAILRAIERSASELKYGFSHGYAGLTDALRLVDQWTEPEDIILALSCAFHHIGRDMISSQGHFPYPDTMAELFDAEVLSNALETEDEGRAIAHIQAAFTARSSEEGLMLVGPPLADYALRHYLGFGHGAIYTYKGLELAQRLDHSAALILIKSLTRALIYGEREECLPEFSIYQKIRTQVDTSSSIDPHLEDLTDQSQFTLEPNVIDEVKNTGSALKWLQQQSDLGISHRVLYDQLLYLNAHNLLSFDLARQEATHISVGASVGWLSFTHAITFANAGRNLLELAPHRLPDILVQLACFYGRNRRYTAESMIKEWCISNREDLWNRCIELSLDSHIGLPIFVTHYLKLTVATFEELDTASSSTAEQLLAALNRFISSPLKQRHRRRAVYQALKLVGGSS